VDCFAKFHIAKLPRFFSRFWNPGTSGIDFVAQSLESENCLVTVPPVHVVARAVHYLHLKMARATIVVLFWPFSRFWPLTNKCKQFIEGYLVRNGAEALRQGRNLNSFLGSDKFIGKVNAVRLEFLG